MRENGRILKMRGMKRIMEYERILGMRENGRILRMRNEKDKGGCEDSWDEGEWEDPIRIR